MKQIITILIILGFSKQVICQVDTVDLNALKAIYNATNGEHWNVHDWSFSDSYFYGVKTHRKKVTEISLGPNRMEGSIPPEIAMLPELKFLSFSSGICVEYNNFLLFENKLHNSHISHTLCENKNHLQSIAREIGQLKKLKTLLLDGNDIESLPKEIGNLENLCFLDIGWNNISFLPEEFENLANLRYLDITGNRLFILPLEIGKLKKLESLQLTHNYLSYIPGDIGNLVELKRLELQYNQIDSLSDEISNLNNLEVLDLSKNDLQQLPEGLVNMKKLKELNLSDNRLTFEDIEPLIGKFEHLSYGSQANVGNSEIIETEIGQDLMLKIDVGGQHNEYQWYRSQFKILNSNSDSLIIKNVDVKDAGSYVCKITNTIVPDLVLETDAFVVLVNKPQEYVDSVVSETQEEIEEEDYFISFYVVDTDGNKIIEYGIGDTVSIIIESENSIGEEYTINIGDTEADFLYEGAVTDTIFHTIESNKDILELVAIEKKEAEDFVDYYIEKKEQNTIAYEPGDIITLVINSSSRKNTSISIDLNDRNADFKYKSKRLKKDIFNYTIKNNEERIKLKVVKQKRTNQDFY